MKRHITLGCLLAASLGLASTFALAEDTNKVDTTPLAVTLAAEPIKRTQPIYPRTAAMRRQEGWVRLSYVIDEQGKVLDPIVHDSSGNKAFEKAALKAIKNWEYAPATVDGEPVQQCYSRIQMDFKMKDTEPTVTRRFRNTYQKVMSAINEGDLVQASELTAKLEQDAFFNHTENNFFWMLQVHLAEATNDSSMLLQALNRIKFSGRGYLSDDAYLSMLQKLFVEQLKANKLALALETYNEVIDTDSNSEVAKKLTPYKDKIEAVIANADPLVIAGVGKGEGFWSHKLARSQFELVAKAPVDKVEIRCDNKRSSYNQVSANTFIIPNQWGQCMVYIDADAGSEFTLVELPVAASDV